MSQKKKTTRDKLNTLRYFPDGQKNCYNLPLRSPQKYLVRAGFYYGNYDGLSSPPIFHLYINGQHWADIFPFEVQYEEIIYPNNKNKLEVCLVRYSSEEIPFISSLEVTQLPSDFYRLMDNHTVLQLQSRTHYGDNKVIGEPSVVSDEGYNRIWKLEEYLPPYPNLTSIRIPNGFSSNTENAPPYAVLADAIVPFDSSDPISLWFDLLPPNVSYYLVFYFNEPADQFPPVNRSRKFQIYLNWQEMALVDVPQNGTSQVVSLYPFTPSHYDEFNVTLSPVKGSTFPPIINAMEVFTTFQLQVVTSGVRSCYYSSMVLAVLLCLWQFYFV